jgi:hypothetical protein
LENEKLEFKGVLFDYNEIANVQDNRKYRIVKKENINQINLNYGFVAAMPALQTVFGGIVALLSLFFIKNVIPSVLHGGTIHTTQLWSGMNASRRSREFTDVL